MTTTISTYGSADKNPSFRKNNRFNNKNNVIYICYIEVENVVEEGGKAREKSVEAKQSTERIYKNSPYRPRSEYLSDWYASI